MKTRVPLYAKIIGWFFLNLAAIVAASWLLLRDQLRFSALPARAAGGHVDQAAQQIFARIQTLPVHGWDGVLNEFKQKHGVEFRIVSGNGRPVAGSNDPLPPELHGRLFGPPRGGRPGGGPPDEDFGPPNGEYGRGGGGEPGRGGEFGRGEFGRGPGEGRRGPRGGPPGQPRGEDFGGQFDGPPGGGPPDDFPRMEGRMPLPSQSLPQQLVVESANPTRYWVAVHVNAQHPEFRNGAFLMAVSDSPTGHGYFFDVTPYLLWGVGVLVLSVLIWFPFVRGLTRSISRMRAATASLAEGRFDAQVEETRRDEVGELGTEINRMAKRLSGYMNGQKRFLGDVAHELCAPTARLQMALSILEQRATTDSDRERLADVREEAEHMGGLVNELLQFSRASVSGRKAELQICPVQAIAEKAARREAGDTSQVRIEVQPKLGVLADPDLLLRALSNLLRNAIRYAGHAGPITIKCFASAGQVHMSVEDCGPGIPAEALPRIFEPFYRPDSARTPGTGGAGLGLAIVQTCMEACGGTVSARNLQPKGLSVTLSLMAVE